jgi:hypothetical protein
MLRQLGGMSLSFRNDNLCIEPVYSYHLPDLIDQRQGKTIAGYRVDDENPFSLFLHGVSLL